jgi:hypothetical protein
MTRKIAGLAAAVAAVSVVACGTAESGVNADTAKVSIERAAQVKLTAVTVPDDARDQGLKASFSNASTVAKDKQVVALFVVKNGTVAKKVSEEVGQSAPKSAKLIVDGNVLVMYAPAGADRSAAVEQAVKAL